MCVVSTEKSSDFWGHFSELYNRLEFGFKLEQEGCIGTIFLLNYSTLWNYMWGRWKWNNRVQYTVTQEQEIVFGRTFEHFEHV